MAGRWVVRGAGHGFHSGCVMRVAGRHDVHAENPGDKCQYGSHESCRQRKEDL